MKLTRAILAGFQSPVRATLASRVSSQRLVEISDINDLVRRRMVLEFEEDENS